MFVILNSITYKSICNLKKREIILNPMCSIGEDDFGDEGGLHALTLGEKTTAEADESVCKCGQKDAVYVLQSRLPECRDCFLQYVRHKFRATLGSSKVLPRDAEVLIVFDDSDEALVLLDMLHYSQTQNNFKRLHCTVRILYMDDYFSLCPIDGEAYRQHLARLRSYLARYSCFESVICTSNATEIRIYNNQDEATLFEQRLLDPFVGTMTNGVESLRTGTSREDYLKCQRNNAIAVAAKFLNTEHVMVADISTKLAIDFIAAITLGRGGSAALDVSLVDNRLGAGLKLIRPLKDLTRAEVTLYICAQQLQPFREKRTCGSDEKPISLQNVTTKFVNDLQEKFPAAVTIIYRTGNKIAPNNGALAEHLATTTCSFCNSEFKYTETTTAIEYSRLVSGPGNTLDRLKNDDEDEVRHKGQCQAPSILCHACCNIQNDCDNKS